MQTFALANNSHPVF